MILSLFRFVFFFVIASAVWRLVKMAFFTKTSDSNYSDHREQSQRTKVTNKGKDKSYIPDNEGDYIDFEEVK